MCVLVFFGMYKLRSLCILNISCMFTCESAALSERLHRWCLHACTSHHMAGVQILLLGCIWDEQHSGEDRLRMLGIS